MQACKLQGFSEATLFMQQRVSRDKDNGFTYLQFDIVTKDLVFNLIRQH